MRREEDISISDDKTDKLDGRVHWMLPTKGLAVSPAYFGLITNI